MIEKLYGRGPYLAKVQAVTNERCNRCMGQNIYQDNQGVYYCLDCYDYGEISSRMSIYRYPRDIRRSRHRLTLDYALTKKQMEGADFLVDCYHERRDGFLQAVCGAGKTEMTFRLILEALENQQKVCFVIPRVAVLKEVVKRLRHHFPDTLVKALHEGHKDDALAPLLLATPQQLIRFYAEFDVMIVDEVDAYPLADNPFLKRLIDKALAHHGVALYMSATKTTHFSKWLKTTDTQVFEIPSRYHFRPLVVPEFQRVKGRRRLLRILSGLCEGHRQTLIFVPTLALGDSLRENLRERGYEVPFVSSRNQKTSPAIESFRRHEIRVLLTTTVLERGVTFADIDCVVVHADHKVFNKASLIQIAGRVGRIASFEDGTVKFIADGISKAMAMARKEIVWMNRKNEMQRL